MSAILVNGHLHALKFVKLLPYSSLVLRGQSRPGLVGPPVVVVRLRHLDVVIEPDNLPNEIVTASAFGILIIGRVTRFFFILREVINSFISSRAFFILY